MICLTCFYVDVANY